MASTDAMQAAGRPRRGRSERAAVRKALATMPGHLSDRAKCRALAARVTGWLIALDQCEDGLELALNRAIAAVEQDPAFALAHDPEANLLADLRRERLQRFEQRGCRQLCPNSWEAETRQIATALEGKFAERFRRLCKNWA